MAFKKEQVVFPHSIPFVMYETNARQVMIHSHDCLELNLILDGNGYYIIENKTYPIDKGDLFIINNSEHHMAVHDGTLHMIVFLFSPEFIWNTPEQHSYLNPFFQRDTSVSNKIQPHWECYDFLRQQLLRIQEEYSTRAAGWELILKSHLLTFLSYLNRFYLENSVEKSKEYQEQSYSRIRGVIEYIHEHFQEPLTLDELADKAAMGKSYFSHYFTSTMTVTVFDYIQQVRINHAALLLKTTSLSILEIALQSGFQSSSYFNKVFKKIVRMTPLSYRKSKDNTIY